ncbi:hypothetical protein P3342_005043 [Pyrenophora teres f. teres]|nr:hypothetical protein P3342_005043 [Pyrenophora teres f. teres]
MPASAAPAFGRNDPYAGLLHIATPPTTKEQANLVDRISSRASGDRRVGKAFEGEGDDATGVVADVITINQAVQGSQPNAKRDAQRGSNFGKVLKGAGEGVGTLIDLVTIGGIIGGQPAQKREELPSARSRFGNSKLREAQRSRGRVFGNIIEGVGGVIGGAADLLTIGGAVSGQPTQKRDSQRSREESLATSGRS